MKNSLKMARLDYFTCKSNLISYGVLLLMTMLFVTMEAPIVVLSITAAWYTALLTGNVFVIQEKNELERLYASLSLETNHIVWGRFLYSYVTFFLSYIVMTIIGSVASVLQNRSFGFLDVIVGLSVSFLLFTFIVGVQFPLYFRFGYMKAKNYGLVIYILLLGAVCMISLIDGTAHVVMILLKHKIGISAASFVIGVIVILISFYFSVKGIQKRK